VTNPGILEDSFSDTEQRCKMLDSRGGEYEDDSLLGFHASSGRLIALIMQVVGPRSTETSV
jgi:hypothetical protein